MSEDFIDRQAIVKLSPMLSPPADRPLTNAEKKERWKIKHGKKVDPAVRALFDAMTPDERADLERKLLDCQRTLADMRVTAKGTLDQRLLLPRQPVKNCNGWNGRKGDRRFFGEPDEPAGRGDGNDDPPTSAEDAAAEMRGLLDSRGTAARRKGEKLPEGKDLASYIKSELGDGRALADFYIDIITMSAKEARRNGVWMNHKLMAAAWLGDRGWGKAKGDDDGKGQVTINLVDYSQAQTQPAPTSKLIVIEKKSDSLPIDDDVGKDSPSAEHEPAVILLDNGGTMKIPEEKKIEVEEIDLRDR